MCFFITMSARDAVNNELDTTLIKQSLSISKMSVNIQSLENLHNCLL